MDYVKQLIRFIFRWANTAQYQNEEPASLSTNRLGINHAVPKNSNLDSNRCLSFNVHNAHGGKVVQFTFYNGKTDEYHNDLFIIADNEDLGTELGIIITRISLTH